MISLERLKLSVPSATASDERLLALLGEAAADAVCSWCNRDFALTEYDEVYDGVPSDRLLLRHYPLRGVHDVRGEPTVVLEVTSAASELARVTVTRERLELFRVTSGLAAVDTVAWSDQLTLGDVADAVEALGGWSARCVSGWEEHPSLDLAIGERGAGLGASGVWAGLRLHTRELSDYQWHPSGWLEGPNDDAWLAGPRSWRVRYTAGYVALPAAVAEACCLWAAEFFYAATRDPALASQAVVGSVAQTWRVGESGPPPRVRVLLEPFRRRGVA